MRAMNSQLTSTVALRAKHAAAIPAAVRWAMPIVVVAQAVVFKVAAAVVRD